MECKWDGLVQTGVYEFLAMRILHDLYYTDRDKIIRKKYTKEYRGFKGGRAPPPRYRRSGRIKGY